MTLPTPKEVRFKNQQVRWDLVDAFLRAIHHSGSLTLLSQKFEISMAALLQRRRLLRLKPLPPGRPRTVKLTLEEDAIFNLITTGTKPSVLARRRGTSQGAVHSIYRRAIEKKELLKLRECQECAGFGIVPCTSCQGVGLHHHVCLACGGDSSTWASAGLK